MRFSLYIYLFIGVQPRSSEREDGFSRVRERRRVGEHCGGVFGRFWTNGSAHMGDAGCPCCSVPVWSVEPAPHSGADNDSMICCITKNIISRKSEAEQTRRLEFAPASGFASVSNPKNISNNKKSFEYFCISSSARAKSRYTVQ